MANSFTLNPFSGNFDTVRDVDPVTQKVYVSKNGNDSTADGSVSKPFLTIKAAIDSITDASAVKEYSVCVEPGTYDEIAGFTFKDFVGIEGNVAGNGFVPYGSSCKINIDPSGLTFNPSASGAVTRIKNVSIVCSSGFTYVASAANQVLTFLRCYLEFTSFNVTGSGGSTQVWLDSCFCYSSISADNTYFFSVFSSIFSLNALNGALVYYYYTDTYSGATTLNGTSQGFFQFSTIFGLSINSAGPVDLIACSFSSDSVIPGTGTITSSVATTINTDAISLPPEANVSLFAGSVVNKKTEAYSVYYTPSVPSDWDVQPTDVKEGLNNLSAQTGAAATSIAGLDSQAANANGLALVSHALSTQSADATHPGMVNTASQTFGGTKTFADIIDSGLTAKGAMYADASKQLASVALTDGQLLIGSTGNNPSANTVTAGSGISISNGAGTITVTNSTVSTGDISQTSFSLTNNQAVAANVTAFAFANGSVRAFEALVSVTIDATSDLFEQVSLYGIQRGADWQMSQSATGDASQVVFSITNAGQIQYTSGNYAGFVSGTVKFRAFVTNI